jgi:hypothetical protein
MKTSIRWVLPAAVILAGIAFASASRQSGTPATPTTPEVAGSTTPPWRDTQDIGNGVELTTVVGFCKSLTDPDTSASVRPVSIHINFLYGVGVLTQVDYLELHPTGTSTPLQFPIAGLDRNIVVPQRPPQAPLNYLVTITPKTGKTWGTVQGVDHLNIVAAQQ